MTMNEEVQGEWNGGVSPDWLWSELMRWCEDRSLDPANYSGLFAIVGRARSVTPPQQERGLEVSNKAVEAAARAVCEDEWGPNSWLLVSAYSRIKAENHARAALLAASSVSPATGFEVAKLEWVRPIGAMAGETLRRVETAFGTYRVWTHAEANGAWYWALHGGISKADGSGTEEECFAAAQSDFDGRVRSCLAPQPSSTDSEVKL